MKTSQGHLFRVTRDADVEIRDDKAADLLALIKESLPAPLWPARPSRSVGHDAGEMVEYLTQSLEIGG
jgi:polyphosphate kinase